MFYSDETEDKGIEFKPCPFPDCTVDGDHLMVSYRSNVWRCMACEREGDDVVDILKKIASPKTDLSFYLPQAVNEIENPARERGCSTGWEVVDAVLGGVRKHEFSILTGGTGQGKTCWGIALMQNLIEKDPDWKFLVVTGEDRGSRVLRKLAAAYHAEQPSVEQLEEYVEMFRNRFHIVNLYENWEHSDMQMDVHTLKKKMEQYIALGVNFIFLDHAHLFVREGENEIEDIRMLCQTLRKLVVTHPIHILLVVQPTKKHRDDRKTVMRHLRGSVLWEQSCWNCITIYRQDEETHLVEVGIEKNRELGIVGDVHLEFNTVSQANYKDFK